MKTNIRRKSRSERLTALYNGRKRRDLQPLKLFEETYTQLKAQTYLGKVLRSDPWKIKRICWGHQQKMKKQQRPYKGLQEPHGRHYCFRPMDMSLV